MAQQRQSKKKSGRRQGQGRRRGRSQQIVMPFERRNYLLILAGLGLVALGYIIMRAENEMDGFLSLYVSPLLLLIGYLEIVYAIIWRPKAAAVEES